MVSEVVEGPRPGISLAVDIGGTFTDVVLVTGDGRTSVDKVLTTHEDLLKGFFAAVDSVLAKSGFSAADVDEGVIHATTVVTNALLENKGSNTALITTKGFSDVLYLRNGHRYDMFDAQIEFPEPLVPKERTFSVDERTLADGTVLKAVDEGEVRALGRKLVSDGVASLAVCLLHSYRNPQNEERLRDILQSEAPDLYISISSEVAPQIREFLRTSTCVINAYTVPISRPYLERLDRELKARGFVHDAMMMLSNGGVIALPIAGSFPVRMIESGPAAGALSSSFYARMLGIPRLLSFDMGGTTAKACIIDEGRAEISSAFEVAHMYRFKQGSGYPVTVPSIDMIEIGAGGGSIASADAMGLLKVGPRSAGSMPGPACYGRGGQDITVTDANLTLGFLDAANFLGGEMPLDAQATASRLAVLASALGVTTQEAAAGIYRIVGETMAAAARAHAVERGVDARGIPVVAFGGAGPLHACYLAELLGSSQVIFPPNASVLSAMGMLVSPVRYDLVVGYLRSLSQWDWEEANKVIAKLMNDARKVMVESGCRPEAIRYSFGADMRYVGQESEIIVNFPGDPRNVGGADYLRDHFEKAYLAQYSINLESEPQVVGLRLTCQGPEIERSLQFAAAECDATPVAARKVTLDPQRPSIDYPVYRRSALRVGQTIPGPVLIEERETTAVVLEEWSVTLHSSGCLIATRS